MRSTQFIRHVLVQIVASLNTSLFFQNRFFQCIVVDVYTMGTRKSSRSTKPPIKLQDFVADDFVAESATPQQMSEAVKRELSQVESMIKDLTPTSFKAEQPTVNDRAFEDLRNEPIPTGHGAKNNLLQIHESSAYFLWSEMNFSRPRLETTNTDLKTRGEM